MSGSTVPWWTMAAGFAATTGVGWCLAGRERGLALVVPAAVVAQGALHSAFSLAQSAASGAGTGSGAHDMSGMAMGSMSMDAMDMESLGSMGSMPVGRSEHVGHLGQLVHGMGGTSSFGMLAAHALAAVLSGLRPAYGEKAAFRVLRAVAGWLAAPLRLSLALPAPSRRPRLRPTCERVVDNWRYAATRPRLADTDDWTMWAERARPSGLPGFDDGVAPLDLLDALPAERREAFVLTQLTGLPYEEAAEASGCPIGTIRSRVARARATLVELLVEADDTAVVCTQVSPSVATAREIG